MIFAPKSQPAPPCLAAEEAKTNGTYRCDGVLHAIRGDFFNKCYICEQKEPTTINVEHFVPHRGNHDLMFEWNNLFYACGHCNNIKLAVAAYDDILNPTEPTHEVDRKIRYHIDPLPKEIAQFNALENTNTVNNTVALLNAVYNGTTTLKTIESANIRSRLLKEIREFQGLLFEYYDETNLPEETEAIKRRIIRHLRSSSAFTAFKRWIIRDHNAFHGDFWIFCG